MKNSAHAAHSLKAFAVLPNLTMCRSPSQSCWLGARAYRSFRFRGGRT